MIVDLHYDTKDTGALQGGIVTLRDGRVFFSCSVGKDRDGDYSVRYCHAEYGYYTQDGKRCNIVDGRAVLLYREPYETDIVKFERCHYDEAKARGIPFNLE